MRYADGRWTDGRWAYDRWGTVGRQFLVAGRNGSPSVANNEVVGQLWNPSTDRSLWVAEIMYTTVVTGTAQNMRIQRTTARGTPATTVTPDLDNDMEREVTPQTGALLDLALFSVQPTVDASVLFRTPPTGGTTAGGILDQIVFPGKGIKVPPGTGLCLRAAAISGCSFDQSWRFEE